MPAAVVVELNPIPDLRQILVTDVPSSPYFRINAFCSPKITRPHRGHGPSLIRELRCLHRSQLLSQPGNVAENSSFKRASSQGVEYSQMILPGDVQGFGLLGADVMLGALDAGMAEQELGGAQIAGLLVDVGGEGAA